VAWRRSGAARAATMRVAIITGLASAAWMAVTWRAAESGALRHWDSTPPPFGLLVVAIVVSAIVLAFSPFGRRLAQFVPLWALVAVQAFRLPLEVAMHELYKRGVMPEQMTYTGRNFDIGLALLVNVVTIAMISTPVFRYFGDDHVTVFVTCTPYVWLPVVMVLAALAGHLLIFSALRVSRR
jgi:hypothetical protein